MKPIRHKDENGLITWRLPNGDLHRVNGPAVVHANGDHHWRLNGVVHRKNGPALSQDSVQVWYKHGALHRLDGPAIVRANGRDEYYVDGHCFLGIGLYLASLKEFLIYYYRLINKYERRQAIKIAIGHGLLTKKTSAVH